MSTVASPSALELAAVTRLFSAAVFRDLAKRGSSALFARLLRQAGGAVRIAGTVGDIFDSAFATLQTSGLRDEYIYRAAVTQKILMGRHSLQTASMLHEFRAGTCKADLVILNGTATAYEIKSERDSLARLSNQVQNYQKVFAAVNVVVSEDHIDGVVAAVPSDVGILCLSKRFQLSVIREAIDLPERICPQMIFSSLRSTEAYAILEALGVKVPDLPNIKRYAAMRDRFAELRPTELHHQMVKTLKKTRNLAPLVGLVEELPRSLHAAALAIQVNRIGRVRLLEAVATPVDAAMAWA